MASAQPTPYPNAELPPSMTTRRSPGCFRWTIGPRYPQILTPPVRWKRVCRNMSVASSAATGMKIATSNATAMNVHRRRRDIDAPEAACGPGRDSAPDVTVTRCSGDDTCSPHNYAPQYRWAIDSGDRAVRADEGSRIRHAAAARPPRRRRRRHAVSADDDRNRSTDAVAAP